MTWELVAMIGVILILAVLSLLGLAMFVVLIMDAKTRREVQLHEAGLMPPGWVSRNGK